MVRALMILLRRLTIAASLLVLLICGAEVAVRFHETLQVADARHPADGLLCNDPSKLTIPSWSYHSELKPLATAKVKCLDSNTLVEIRTNRHGLRGLEPAVPKPRDVYRIVVLGDETIFAPETADADHFCAKLQSHLQQRSNSKVEVINAGIPGHCPLTEFVFFEQRLIGLQPDLVILHFDWSDIADDRSIRRHTKCDDSGRPQSCAHARLATTKKIQQLEAWRQQFRLFDRALCAVGTEWKHHMAQQRAVSRDLDTNPYAWLRDEHPEENVAFRNAVKPVVDLVKLCRSSNCQFVLMTSPKPWQVSVKCSRGKGVRIAAGVARDACYLNRAPFDILARFANRQNIPFIDGSPALAQGTDVEANFLNHAPRWSPVGHARMSELVATALVEKIPGVWSAPYQEQNLPSISNAVDRERTIQWTSGEQQRQPAMIPPRYPSRPVP